MTLVETSGSFLASKTTSTLTRRKLVIRKVRFIIINSG